MPTGSIKSYFAEKGFGFIIRTAGIGRTKIELKRDLSYLQRLWKAIETRRKGTNVGELYTEADLIIRTIRDVYATDIERIIVDHEGAARRVQDFLRIINPRSGSNVLVYGEPVPLFHRYEIEQQIEGINHREVPLPSGGSLVIDSTEALVAVDVNSGKMRDNRDAETTAFKTNKEATDEICRQLRLRDLGGVVVIDLIDMRDLKRRRTIEQQFRENLKKDRARTRILTISQFGILEMTRQRMRPSLKTSIYSTCTACNGDGLVKSIESVVLDVMRRLSLALHREKVTRVELTVSPDVAFQLLNRRRGELAELETRFGKQVMVRVNGSGPMDFVDLTAYDNRGSVVDAETLANLPKPDLAQPDPTSAAVSAPPADEPAVEEEAPAKPKRRRRRKRSSKAAAATPTEETTKQPAVEQAAPQKPPAPRQRSQKEQPAETVETTDTGEEPPKKKSSRRRGGRGRRRSKKTTTQSDPA